MKACHKDPVIATFGRFKLDGAPFDVEVSAAPVRWGAHDGGMVFLRDITKRLELEERLRHNQIMLARTERIAQIGSWEWEVATDSVMVGRAV